MVRGDLSKTLASVRVLDLSRNLAGPYCTQILSELGADVIKIEQPTGGDDTRGWSPRYDDGRSAMFGAANRGKRSVALDLDAAGGAELVRRLAVESDVVVETFRPGALDRRGLGWDRISTVNPRIVYCSVSAYGRTGPRAADPGYDPVVQAASGIMSITGHPDAPPARLGISALDLGSGLWAVVGIMSALALREQTGHGMRIDTSLFETAAWWLSYHVAMYDATGLPPGRFGTSSAAIAPYQAFATADAELFVAAANDRLFEALCAVLDRNDLPSDPRFASNAARVEHVDELILALESRLRTRSAEEWHEALRAAGVPSSPIRSVRDLAHDPQTAALGLLAASGGRLGVGMPISGDARRPPLGTRAPELGEHTDDVLIELGLSGQEIADLRAARVVA